MRHEPVHQSRLPSQDGSRRLNCLIEGESIVFPVTMGHDCEVSQLKEAIQSRRKNTISKDVDSDTLALGMVDIDLKTHDKCARSNIRLGDVELESWETILHFWPDQPPKDHLQIIVKAPVGKRKRDDPTDISQKLCRLWTKPVAPDLQHLKEYFEKPLDPDWKIPLSYNRWKEYLASELSPAQACSDEDLELLFKQSEDETAVGILRLFYHAITRDPVNPSGTERSLISFWDRNIRDILEQSLGVACIRDSNQGTETGKLRPGFGLLLSNVCVFRGEEKRIGFAGTHPRDELRHKTRWVYDPAPYTLGYYAVGMEVVLVAIVQPRAESLLVVDLISADLSSRRERIKNAIETCVCSPGGHISSIVMRYIDFRLRDGGKSIEYFSSNVRKTYELEDKDFRRMFLTRTGLRKLKFSTMYMVHTSICPKSPLDVRNAVVCVLEALKVAHADPPVFHRDIRWQNIIQSCEDSSKWSLIDWEDASFAPTKGAPHLSQNEHSPNVYKDNHGADVDIWAVRRLIFTALLQVPALRDHGQMMMEGHVLNLHQHVAQR
ncbi:hypothetical protein JOM56_010192 [Amanita muscaria]